MADKYTSALGERFNADPDAFTPLSIEEVLALADSVRQRGGMEGVAEALVLLARRRAESARQSPSGDAVDIPTKPMPL